MYSLTYRTMEIILYMLLGLLIITILLIILILYIEYKEEKEYIEFQIKEWITDKDLKYLTKKFIKK